MGHDPSPQTRLCPAVLQRVGRAIGPIHYNEIDALDAELADVGNRYDVIGGGVMYASSERAGAYKEALASFRPAASSFQHAAGTNEHLMAVGAIPASWREKRRMVAFSLKDPLPFLDVEQDATLSVLTREIASVLQDLQIENLDQG